MICQRDVEREASLKHSLEELDAKKKEIVLLVNQVKDLEQRLQQADTKTKEKVIYRLMHPCHFVMQLI